MPPARCHQNRHIAHYEGQSASQLAQDAARSSQPSWQARQSQQEWYSNVDYNHPWFEKRDGEWYCLLCSAWATDGHVASDKHTGRASHPDWYGFNGGGPQEVTWHACYDKPWFEQRDGEFYCLLCGNWATDGHIESEKHRKRAEYPDSYGFPIQSPMAALPPPPVQKRWERFWSEQDSKFYYHNASSGATQWETPPEWQAEGSAALPPSASYASASSPAAGFGSYASASAAAPAAAAACPSTAIVEYRQPWLEQREGELYCLICPAWATDGHLASARHRKRAAHPEWYGFPEHAAASASAATTPQARFMMAYDVEERPHLVAEPRAPDPPKVAEPWVAHYSEEHARYYFHNNLTGGTQWDYPEHSAAASTPAPPTNAAGEVQEEEC